ncbi:hypothetical protein QFC19_000464 [Naganishia cerealis]|uniref:Uncharacterized protein n=1 Tax=Naganishia cerealis TaxID=610337 RepID=A0ACC2WNY0_9TREE|nr:hypothetical protein QFC19_000464 [Naganishia cerealis]
MIGSIEFPWSFAADVMHILLENIMKELLTIWEGKYKLSLTNELGVSSVEEYVLPRSIWDAIDVEVSTSNSTIPAQMARWLGSITKRGYWTAETYSYFLMHLGPIVLKGRLPPYYYDHYLQLSNLSKLLTKLEITVDENSKIRSGLVEWVKGFERCVTSLSQYTDP